jgi:hypothetical protein
MAQVHGIVDRKPMVMLENGYWTDNESQAHEFTIPEAEQRVRVININNRFMDAEDRITARVVESR